MQLRASFSALILLIRQMKWHSTGPIITCAKWHWRLSSRTGGDRGGRKTDRELTNQGKWAIKTQAVAVYYFQIGLCNKIANKIWKLKIQSFLLTVHPTSVSVIHAIMTCFKQCDSKKNSLLELVSFIQLFCTYFLHASSFTGSLSIWASIGNQVK